MMLTTLLLRDAVSKSPDEARDKDGKWTAGGGGTGDPVKRVGYREFKQLKAERFFVSEGDFKTASRILRAERRANPGQKQWMVFSLGSSWHDPQAMGKIVSGPKVPDGVKPVSTGLDLRAAFRHMVSEEREAFGRSRNADY